MHHKACQENRVVVSRGRMNIAVYSKCMALAPFGPQLGLNKYILANQKFL